MSCVSMKYGYYLRLAMPICHIIQNQLHVKYRCGQITFEGERPNTKDGPHLIKFDGHIDVPIRGVIRTLFSSPSVACTKQPRASRRSVHQRIRSTISVAV